MPTIEEMRTELEAAGYRLQINNFGYGSFFEIRYEDSQYGDIQFEPWYNADDTVKKAYAHYLQQQRSAKMKALLEGFVIAYENLDMLSTKDIISEFVNAAKEAKAILAEKETS